MNKIKLLLGQLYCFKVGLVSNFFFLIKGKQKKNSYVFKYQNFLKFYLQKLNLVAYFITSDWFEIQLRRCRLQTKQKTT